MPMLDGVFSEDIDRDFVKIFLDIDEEVVI